MRRVGILGGMSWESSIEYERLINQGVRARLGGTSAADLIIRSYNFADIEQLQADGDWQRLTDLLASDAAMLEAAGADDDSPATRQLADLQERIQSGERRLTEIREEVLRLRRELVDEQDLANVLHQFDPLWKSLSTREQARVLQLLIERIDYDGKDGKVSVTFRPSGITELVTHEEEAA